MFRALLELADSGSSLEDEEAGSVAGPSEEEEDLAGLAFSGTSGMRSGWLSGSGGEL